MLRRHLLSGAMAISLVPATVFCADAALEARAQFLDVEDRARRFQSAAEIFPHTVMRAAGTPRPLLPAAGSGDFAPRYQWQGQTYTLEQFCERVRVNAMLILKDGRIVSEIYRNGSDAGTRFLSFSIVKPLLTSLVGIAVADGHINSISDPLTDYLPELEGTAYDGVSVRDALQMTSGVQWNEINYEWDDERNDMLKYWIASVVEQRFHFTDPAQTLDRGAPPGTRFNYSTMDSALLGRVLEAATGEGLSPYMERVLWQPAGMEADAHWLLDGPPGAGDEMAAGLLTATLRDFGRFGQLVLDGGRTGDRQVIPEAWLRAATTADRTPLEYGNLIEGYPLGYGYQWWLFEQGYFEAQGVFGQFIFIAPAQEVVIVLLSDWPDAWVDELELEVYAFFTAVLESLAVNGETNE